jgi:hypothetical protein
LFTNDWEQDFAQLSQFILGVFHQLELKITNQVSTSTFLQYITEDGKGELLKIDLVKEIPVHFGEFLIKEGGIRIDSLENIGSNKILAIFGRTDAKDFIDLYWILQRTKFRFDDLYRQAQEKDGGLTELYLAYAFQNVEKIRLFPRVLKPLPWEEIKAFYQALARELLMRIKPE